MVLVNIDVQVLGHASDEQQLTSTTPESDKSISTTSDSLTLAQAVNHVDDVEYFRMQHSFKNKRIHGVNVSFENVSVTVVNKKKKKSKKCILSCMSGYMVKGTLTAIIGPSGSGKTTLIDMITMRKNTGVRQGTVLYDGKVPTQRVLSTKISYVQQEDALIETLTVRETLHYYYDLVSGKEGSTSRGARKEVVHDILHQLGLESCADVLIGSSYRRGISGGQRKRVNLGIHLIGNPSLLIMDEPSSGLDSFHAVELIHTVSALCSHSGITAITTIHSPSPSIFASFDKLMILLDGNLVYFGDATPQSVEYFSAIGFVKSSDQQADADWLCAIIVQTSRLDRSNELASLYEESDLKQQNDMVIQELGNHKSSIQAGESEDVKLTFCQYSGLWSMWCIMKHRIPADLKKPSFVIPLILQKVLVAVLLGSVYWNVARHDMSSQTSSINLDSLQEQLSQPISITTALSMWATIPVFGNIAVIPGVYYEKTVFLRDQKSGCYDAAAYLTAKLAQNMLLDIFILPISACIVWFSLGLSGSWFLFFFAFFMNMFIGRSMAYFFSFICPNVESAVILSSGVNVIFLCFVGVLIRPDNIPVYWKWVMYINQMHYTWAALMKNQFSPTDLFGPTTIPVQSYFGLSNSLSSWDYIGILFGFAAFYYIVAYASLKYVNYGKR